MKILKKLGLLILLVILVAQFFGPEKNDGDIASVESFFVDTNPPEDVKLILKTACFDCHSDYTRYPWYNNITPINYWLDGHIRHGKGNFNVSKWNDYSEKQKGHKLEELIEMVEARDMPLESYTLAHNDAKLTDAQIEVIVEWVQMARLKYAFIKEPE